MNPEEIKIWKSYRSHQIKQLIKMLRQHWGNQVFKLKVESVIWHLATVRIEPRVTMQYSKGDWR